MTETRTRVDCQTCRKPVTIENGWIEWVEEFAHDGTNHLRAWRVCHCSTRCIKHEDEIGRRDHHLSHFVDDESAIVRRLLDASTTEARSLAHVLEAISIARQDAVLAALTARATSSKGKTP